MEGGELVVATVRPETMLGDTAVAVNPKDERYADAVGKTVTLPLVGQRAARDRRRARGHRVRHGRAEDHAGSRPADFEIGQQHGLDAVSVIGEDGRMTDEAPERFRGMTAEGGARRVDRRAAVRGA